jgi:simple sugar transport system permease protein
MEMSFVIGVLVGALQAGTSVLYAALGEVVVERSGVINLGLEGSMLMGASVGFAVTYQTGNPWLGLIAAALAGALFNLVLAFLVVTRGANQLASGLAGFRHRPQRRDRAALRRPDRRHQHMPIQCCRPPVLARPVSARRLIYAVPMAFFQAGALPHRWGLPSTVGGIRQSPMPPAWCKTAKALFVGGLLAGLGGAHLSLAFTGVWGEQMTSGRGFIAVALVIFAAWSPLRAVLGALLFGGALAFQLQLQARGAPVSPFFLDMIPYLLTLGVLLFLR